MAPNVIIGYSACPLTREAFQRAGCNAYTCDQLPARDGNTTNHIQADVWDVLLKYQWDFGVLHPMCTYLAVSAAWAYKDPPYHQRVSPTTLTGAARRAAREDAIVNFRRLRALPFPCAIENPSPSFLNTAVCAPDQVIQPHQFGDDASKSTGLWLTHGTPKLQATRLVFPRIVNGKKRWGNQTDSGQNKLTPSHTRWLERSKTYPGIAAAMGDQWGRWLHRSNH